MERSGVKWEAFVSNYRPCGPTLPLTVSLLPPRSCIKQNGHFLQVGKVDVKNVPLGLGALHKNVSFYAIDIGHLAVLDKSGGASKAGHPTLVAATHVAGFLMCFSDTCGTRSPVADMGGSSRPGGRWSAFRGGEAPLPPGVPGAAGSGGPPPLG